MKRSSKNREMSEHRIAVVEEVADNIYSVKFILQSLGYPVSSFSSQLTSTEPLLEFAPDLIIVDMMIPHHGAYLAIRRLRENGLPDVPVLAITADAMEGEEKDVFEAGGTDILSKPYSVADLQQKLEKWL